MSRHPIFSDEHEELRASVRRYVDTEVRPHVDEWEDLGFFPDSVFRPPLPRRLGRLRR